MKNLGRPSRSSSRNRLLNLLTTEFEEAHQANDLFDEFLRHETYNETLCLSLLAMAKQKPEVSWNIRRLAILMLEHQILKLHPDNLQAFDLLLTRLQLKEPGLDRGMVSSVLREGYSTTDLRNFVAEFRSRLERLNRVHDQIRGRRTGEAALRDFIELSRCDCKLSLARYLFEPDEIVDEILRRLQVSDGVQDLDTSQPQFVKDERTRATNLLPDFEARILKRLCETSNIYWVSETTSSEINALVEYPISTVVLVIKPPGSDVEFEIKRAGRKGPNSLSVVYARDGYTVPPSHRLDGGSMQWLLRYEARAASRFGLIYRLVHGTEAPIARYISRSTVYSVPVQEAEAQTLTYFTEPNCFGRRFREMRVAMEESVAAFKSEGYGNLPDLPGDLGLTAQFIGLVAPAQAILCGTTSFRLDKLAAYLSSDGSNQYFKDGLKAGYSRHDARRFADAILEEILGCYRPPDVRYQSYKQYLAAAFAVAENRSRADRVYLSLVQQIAKCWGTLLGVRGYSRGESFVARNVGLKSIWDAGEWKVQIIFMDHDALVVSGPGDKAFFAHGALPNMALDESFIWGTSSAEQISTSEVGYLQKIYRIGEVLKAEGEALARVALRAAYKKTQNELLTNPRLRSLFNKEFLEKLFDWNRLVGGYLQANGSRSARTGWKKGMREMLSAKRYSPASFDTYLEALENNRAFLERYSFLFDLETGKKVTQTEA